MAELIQQYTWRALGPDDVTYTVFAGGQDRADGKWEGWIEFHPEVTGLAVLRTDRETTQPSRDALVYWASGLEPVYFEGALERALVHSTGQTRGTRA